MFTMLPGLVCSCLSQAILLSQPPLQTHGTILDFAVHFFCDNLIYIKLSIFKSSVLHKIYFTCNKLIYFLSSKELH